MKTLDRVVLALLVFAGVNWGLWGLFEFNLVYYIFGREWIDRFIYVILGFSGIYVGIGWNEIRRRCSPRIKK
jgi:uncharacterized membrane protein YuzA (DUF378 family)